MVEGKVNKKSLYKFLFLGDQGCGKTSIMTQYVINKFHKQYKATIGCDFLTKQIQLNNGQQVTAQIWDTAGQERYMCLGSAFYRGADACFLVFDYGNIKSFEKLQQFYDSFIENIDKGSEKNVIYCLIGNKIDLEERKVGDDQINQWWEQKIKKPFLFFQCSAKTGSNIKEAFLTIAQKCYEKQNSTNIDDEEAAEQAAPSCVQTQKQTEI